MTRTHRIIFYIARRFICGFLLLFTWWILKKLTVLEKHSFFSMIYISFLFESFILKDS